jgi:ferredoxin
VLAAQGATADGGRVRFRSSAREIEADGVTPLLVAGEQAGVLLPSDCRMGICHTCVGRLRCGAVRDLRTGELHDTAGELVRACVCAAAGPVQIEL